MRLDSLSRDALDDAARLLASSCEYDEAAHVSEEKLFGEAAHEHGAQPIGAFHGETLVGLACTSDRYLRLLAVDPRHRGKGIGAALLNACEEQIGRSSRQVRTMDQPGNYLSPGIDQRNEHAIAWLERRGYKRVGTACNVLIEVQNNPRVSADALRSLCDRVEGSGYHVLRLPESRIEQDSALVARHFSRGWAFEIGKAALNTPAAVHIAIDAAGALAGFAAHDGNNRGLGWFGPTGTFAEHRGKGIGAALLMSCLLDVRAAGHPNCQVAWIGPREFYDKIAGIDSERHFTVLSKELN